ncbi:hypothetical protein CEP54_010002 [Fusarium duplospermum]|uniref:Uncharacterized protein n=1 Tax=Fusarium duplospermum TaxID=1325734 RepID=A0A428PMK9_9HYPO|nr:hypothetical protein CEP54_010002 [Fusarium duplospermum]
MIAELQPENPRNTYLQTTPENPDGLQVSFRNVTTGKSKKGNLKSAAFQWTGKLDRFKHRTWLAYCESDQHLSGYLTTCTLSLSLSLSLLDPCPAEPITADKNSTLT